MKWFFSSLIISLTLLGAIFQHQAVVPNQEIVFQFVDREVTSVEAENTIVFVKEQLQRLGAENIQVREDDGTLKITYYSISDVASIKETLSKDGHLETDAPGKKQIPSEKNPVDYNFDIYEIHEAFDIDANSVGFVLEPIPKDIGTESDRFFNPNFAVSINENSKEDNKTSKEAQKVYSYIALAIDCTSYKIPEVRAGPNS